MNLRHLQRDLLRQKFVEEIKTNAFPKIVPFMG